MVCFRCNHENEGSGSVCKNCGSDLFISAKAANIAIKLYNKGLSLATERKLTEAAEAINKSICYNRFSIDARNLLGLVYFELGMVADALKQWAISASYYGEHNPATVYLARIKDNVREMEKMNNAVKMYNQGLANLRNKNEDMAIIQLKKAIELNPKLIEAKNLLALIYAAANNTQQASALIDSVNAYDEGNKKARFYKYNLGQASVNAQRYKQQTARQGQDSPARTFDPYIQKKVKRFGGFPLSELLCLLIGAACSVAAIYILVIPSIEASVKEETERQIAAVESVRLEQEKTIAEKDAQIEELENKYSEAMRVNADNEAQMSLLDKQQKIMTAVSLSIAGNIKESAAIIKDMDTTGLGDADLSQYNSVKETVFPKTALAFFDEGRAAYNAQQYEEAKTAFLSGLEYGMTISNAGDAYYYLGRIAENDDDFVSARLNYERTVNEYDECTQYNNALNRLRALEQ